MRLSKGIIAFISCCFGCLLVGVFTGSGETDTGETQPTMVVSETISPEIPTAIRFCGQTIDLTRYNLHEGLDRELSAFTYLHSTTLLLIKRANRYFPLIEPILKDNGIPDDFKYLAVIESHLDPRATSAARAVGLWQLLEGTARQYGLTITPTIDERCDVEKSTRAACRYLKAAYDKYGDWAVVASSYNAGMSRISGELSKQKADHSLNLWLVEETTRYVFRIMAVKMIFEHPGKYGFMLHPQDLYKPIACTEVKVDSDIKDLSEFARQKNVTYADLKRFNPWLRDRKLHTRGKTYTIKIPRQQDMFYHTPNRVVHNPDWVIQ